jgi:hypothetical protein
MKTLNIHGYYFTCLLLNLLSLLSHLHQGARSTFGIWFNGVKAHGGSLLIIGISWDCELRLAIGESSSGDNKGC